MNARADALIRQMEKVYGASAYPSDPGAAETINAELNDIRTYQSGARVGRSMERTAGYADQARSFNEEAARLQAKVEEMMLENEEYEQATALLDLSQPLDQILAGQARDAAPAPYVTRQRERIEQQAQERHQLYGGRSSARTLGLRDVDQPGKGTSLIRKLEGGYVPPSYGGLLKFGMSRRSTTTPGGYDPVEEHDPWRRKRPGSLRRV